MKTIRRNKPEQKEDTVETVTQEVKPEVKKPKAILRDSKPAEVVAPEPTVWDTSGNFEDMLKDFNSQKAAELEMGSKVPAKLLEISDVFAFFDLGDGREGTMSLEELKNDDGEVKIKKGDIVDAFVLGFNDGILLGLVLDSKSDLKSMLEKAFSAKIPMEGKVTAMNKGGFEIDLNGTRAFCPKGQIDNRFIENGEEFVGQTFQFVITQYEPGSRNVVVSRRAILQEEHQKKVAALLTNVSVGDRVNGKVSRVEEYGVFVDIGGGILGLVPNSELGYGSFSTAKERLPIGTELEVAILAIDDDQKRKGEKRIRLSIKTVMADPFTAFKENLTIGNKLPAKVARMESFGAFVELCPGVDGLIHISEICTKRIRHPNEILTIGQDVEVRVLDADLETRKISLSLKEETPLFNLDKINKAANRKKSNSIGTFADLFAGKLKN